MQEHHWTSTGGNYTDSLPKLSFPLSGQLPSIFAPHKTVLRLPDGDQSHVWLWCYLNRRVNGKRYLFEQSSLSDRRCKDLRVCIERLSKRFRFDDARPESIKRDLQSMSGLLNWLDDPAHKGRYESILSDADLALDALKRYHSHLRQRLQSNDDASRLAAATASNRDRSAIKTLSIVHNREYGNEIEAISFVHGEGVKPPEEEHVADFMACVQGVFDSVSRFNFEDDHQVESASPRELRWQSCGRDWAVSIPSSVQPERLLELACMSFAALCIGDSGANLAQIQSFEEPANLGKQLQSPDRVSLRHKVVKFRAGGKEVPVHLTSTTVTRLSAYLRLRETLYTRLGDKDIGRMFIQCAYPASSKRAKPLSIIPLEKSFTSALRRRFSGLGIKLRSVTMQQLRAYKHGKFSKDHNPKLAADAMGTSVVTAIRRYSKISEAQSASELAPFLDSLASVVVARSATSSPAAKNGVPATLTEIPPGKCEDHGRPKAASADPLIEPDCNKTEGCFFCDNFHVHADIEDSKKLMSCRLVLERVDRPAGHTGSSDRVYISLMGRIDALLNEIKRVNPMAYEKARRSVYDEGQLTAYWATKLQQMHLLGLLARPGAPGNISSPV